jgi:hypothetical protein
MTHSTLYHCTKPTAQARAAFRSSKPVAGNSGRYFAVRDNFAVKEGIGPVTFEKIR